MDRKYCLHPVYSWLRMQGYGTQGYIYADLWIENEVTSQRSLKGLLLKVPMNFQNAQSSSPNRTLSPFPKQWKQISIF